MADVRSPEGPAPSEEAPNVITEAEMLALVDESLVWAFDHETLDRDAFRHRAESLLDDLLYMAGLRGRAAVGDPAPNELLCPNCSDYFEALESVGERPPGRDTPTGGDT